MALEVRDKREFEKYLGGVVADAVDRLEEDEIDRRDIDGIEDALNSGIVSECIEGRFYTPEDQLAAINYYDTFDEGFNEALDRISSDILKKATDAYREW